MISKYENELRVLRDTLAERDEEIIQLKQRLAPPLTSDISTLEPALWKLCSGQTRRLLVRLWQSKGRIISNETLCHAIHGTFHDDYAAHKTLNVYIYKLRVNIRVAGSQIDVINEWGQGYGILQLPAEEIEAFRLCALAGYPNKTRSTAFYQIIMLLKGKCVLINSDNKVMWSRLKPVLEAHSGRTLMFERQQAWFA